MSAPQHEVLRWPHPPHAAATGPATEAGRAALSVEVTFFAGSAAMQRPRHPMLMACAALSLMTSIAVAAPKTGRDGPVQQYGGPVSQKPSLPPLSLSDPQRQQIAQA